MNGNARYGMYYGNPGYNVPLEYRNPPFEMLRSHLYPKWAYTAKVGIQKAANGYHFPRPYYPGEVLTGRAPFTFGPLQAQRVADPLLKIANKRLKTLPERIVTDYFLPKARPRQSSNLLTIRQVPFIPLSQLPPAAVRLQAALNNPLLVRGKEVVSSPNYHTPVEVSRNAIFQDFRRPRLR